MNRSVLMVLVYSLWLRKKFVNYGSLTILWDPGCVKQHLISSAWSTHVWYNSACSAGIVKLFLPLKWLASNCIIPVPFSVYETLGSSQSTRKVWRRRGLKACKTWKLNSIRRQTGLERCIEMLNVESLMLFSLTKFHRKFQWTLEVMILCQM